ncbi:MAG: (2Fe-2S) ferredoxin domain-containing protein [Bacillota bacterium]|nr:(2Fe-2S) ferredoxin domain-containing protein [Bacillota bacterium]
MITITVCIGSSCHIQGSYTVVTELEHLISRNNLTDIVVLEASFCLGNCTRPVSVKINNGPVLAVCKDNVKEFFDEYIVKKLSKSII